MVREDSIGMNHDGGTYALSPTPPSPSLSPPTSPLTSSPTSFPSTDVTSSGEQVNGGVLPNNQPSDDVLNASLYLNASLSLVTALLLIMSFSLKHNLTDAALQDLLQLVSYFIPKPNIWVSSLYTFKKIFNTTQLKSTCIYIL